MVGIDWTVFGIGEMGVQGRLAWVFKAAKLAKWREREGVAGLSASAFHLRAGYGRVRAAEPLRVFSKKAN
eukprot:5983441-Pleurochrysis_carterae.AAC.1